MEIFDSQSIQRATKALRCLPLNSNFYSDSREEGLNAKQVFLRKSNYQVVGTKWFKHASTVEAAFRWLITIGVLRREVDGQGLTSKVRLTPLGRQIIDKTPELPNEKAGILDRLINCLYRKLLWR